MGIYSVKIYKRIKSKFKKMLWKLIYLRKVEFGKKTVFYPETRITIEKGGKIIFGNNCFFNHNCSFNCLGKIEIGNNCIFGENVKIYDHNHNYKKKNILIKEQGYDIGNVKIGNNCWIGSDVIILSNVKIGDNVVIGAGTIINKNIEDNMTVVNDISIKKIGR